MLDSTAVTKRFYARFKVERAAFLTSTEGIPTETERVEYASLILNRLIFVHFLQQKGLLDGNTNYLCSRLHMVQASRGRGTFYRHFLLRFFREGLGGKQAQTVDADALLGKLPYFHIGLFKEHPLEHDPTPVFIADEAFVRLFAFFDNYQWLLDEGPLHSAYELRPDVLGFICEQSIHQKELGAYYTREDVTEYIASNTIIPYLFGRVEAGCPLTFRSDGSIWRLLQADPDRYIHEAVRCTDSLPMETEQEYQRRRVRYERLHTALTAGDIHTIHDLITCNLNIRQFAQDVLERCEELEVLRAFYECISAVTILDPTCGTGAFLLAALTVLEPLYRICVRRLQELDERTIIASIIANNLYGVDIMEEAIEVCKMRLLLKWLAYSDREEDCSALSNLHCNLRVGNVLAGDWRTEFDHVIKHRGFDVIIGNPPYVEYSKIRQDYTVYRYETRRSGNLYAAVLERSLTLCRPGLSYLGLIVPLSICSGERFGPLRATLSTNVSSLWLSSFEIFPCRLFEGAFQRLSILLAKHGHSIPPAVHVTRIQRWYAAERPHLLPLIRYVLTQCLIKPDVFPKLASSRQETILRKMFERARGSSIADMLCPYKTEHFVYYQEATNYWIKATCTVPFHKKNGLVMKPPHGRFLFFRDEHLAHTVMALMNSSLLYLWFATYSDGFHLSHTLVKEFPIARELYESKELSLLSVRLEEDIRAHVHMSTRNTQSPNGQKKSNHHIEIEEYRMGQSKALLDEIDAVLARYYHFTDDELEFIIHYDSKYRMGQENGQREA